MHRLAHLARQRVEMWPRDRRKRRLLPGRMGKPHEPQAERIGLPVGVEGSMPCLVRVCTKR
jgi:hypothetical protein